MSLVRSIAVAAALLTACASGYAANGEVRVWGSLRAIMHEGARDGVVEFRYVLLAGYNHAVGALHRLRGEVMIDLGATCLQYSSPSPLGGLRESSVLLVAARVEAWREIPVEADIPAGELDRRLEEILAAEGVDLTRAVAIRITGPTADVAWHIVDGRKLAPNPSHEAHATTGPHGVLETSTAPIAGFFSKHDHGRFTHFGQNTHLHNCRGHIDSLRILRGARLHVPRPR